MRKIIVGAMVSMDGVMQAPAADEDPTKASSSAAGRCPISIKSSAKSSTASSRRNSTSCSAARLRDFRRVLPYYEDAPHGGIAKLFNDIKKYAVSRSGEVDTTGALSAPAHIADVKRLKQEDGRTSSPRAVRTRPRAARQ